MDEAKRIVRYTLPGLVFIFLLVVSFIILNPRLPNMFLEKKDIGLGKIFTAFIISGCLGYIFSIIYFGFYWFISLWGYHIYNHLFVVKALISSNKLKVVSVRTFNQTEIETNPINRRQAWHIVNMYWHSRKKIFKEIEGVSEKLEPYYSDITTALGTTLIAAVFSFITFNICLNTYFPEFESRAPWCNLLYIMFIIIIGLNFWNTYLSYQRLVNITFATTVNKEYEAESFTPVKIVFYE